MNFSIAGSTGNLRGLPDNSTSSSLRTGSRLFDALDLAVTNSELSKSKPMETLGRPREVRAGVERLDRASVSSLQECIRGLGETAQNTIRDLAQYAESGRLSPELPEELVNALADANEADQEQTPHSRSRSLLSAGLPVLDGPNLLNAGVRTGLIVTLTSVLRDLVAYHVEQAISEGQLPEATRTWVVVGLTLVGPALSLMGAVRDNVDSLDTVKTRLGRILMASIVLGSFIAAQSTGAAPSLMGGAVGVTLYTLSRDLANAFFPLSDNAGGASDLAIGAGMVSFGAVQFALAELTNLLPLSGAAQAAAGLDYNVVASLLPSAINGFGAFVDDHLLPVFKHLFPIAQAIDPRATQISPESVNQIALQVRAEGRIPTWSQLGNSMFNVSASRTSAFHAINLAVASAAVGLAESALDDDNQGHILNVCLAVMLMLIYFPFIWSCSQRPADAATPAPLNENPEP